MKAVERAEYSVIHGRIVNAASSAWNKHKVVTNMFVIDLQAAPLADELRKALAEFNLGRRKYRLERLWVIYSDGAGLDQIPLRKERRGALPA